MAAQLTLALPTTHHDPIRLPADHPVAMLALSPPGQDYPGFEAYCDLVDDAMHERAAELWNAIGGGGSQIRWNPDTREFISTKGDPYSEADVYATVRGLSNWNRNE